VSIAFARLLWVHLLCYSERLSFFWTWLLHWLLEFVLCVLWFGSRVTPCTLHDSPPPQATPYEAHKWPRELPHQVFVVPWSACDEYFHWPIRWTVVLTKVFLMESCRGFNLVHFSFASPGVIVCLFALLHTVAQANGSWGLYWVLTLENCLVAQS
jgi:hypothetical protein